VDAVTSVWLLKRFMPGWEEAEVKFVPAGETLESQIPDIDPEIIHVDTGMGMCDHHQSDEDTCAARKTMEYIAKSQKSKVKSQKLAGRIHKNFPDEALVRMVNVVNEIDHFRDSAFPNPSADYYDFGMVGIMDGWKLLYAEDSLKIVQLAMLLLDGIYKSFQNKVWAEKEITEEGIEFRSKWGKGLAVETVNDEVVRLAQKIGFVVAVRKDPKKGFVRIKGLPSSKVNLTSTYKKLTKLDSEATWFLHASNKMLLNGSMKNPKSIPTRLTLREIVETIKK
jgi:hypothetical protein